MTPKRRLRTLTICLLVIGVGVAVGLTLMALQKNINLFFSPSQVVAGEAPPDHVFRLGGLVERGSVQRRGNDLTVHFTLTDTKERIPVVYSGILPDLFREGQGIITQGRLDDKRVFVADQVLAKHDENYMPPEVHDALQTAKDLGFAEQ